MVQPPHEHERPRGRTFAADLLASIVVFLVALPLCMGIAIASGVPPALGLITGIIGGLVVGFLAGAPLQVSGPAAGLAVIVWDLVREHGLEVLGPIVLLGGAIQLAAGLARGGRWFRAVPPSVIHGMLAGIGVLILGGQFHVMLDDRPRGSGLTNLVTIPGAAWKALTPEPGTVHHYAAAVGLLTIASVILWARFGPKQVKFLPAALVGVLVGSAAAGALGLPIAYVAVPDDLVASANWARPAQLRLLLEPSILGAALALAVIASAETLLCAGAVDRMAPGHRTKYNKELAAQGVGNILCGIFGALPMTGVIVRSTANIQAGGQTRVSAILHGVWLLVLVVAAPFVLRAIPVSALAALLVYTGYKLAAQPVVAGLRRYGRSEVAIYFATIVAIVSTDLLKGVIIGMGLALAKLIYTFAHLSVRVEEVPSERRTSVILGGSATFLRLPTLAEALEAIPPDREVHIRFDGVHYVDHACLELLARWEKEHKARGGRLSIDWEGLEFRSRSPKEQERLAEAA